MSSPVDSAVCALAESDWAQYTAHVRQLANLEEREQVWRQIGRAQGHGVDLFERLLAWPHEDCRNALRYLAPATAHVALMTTSQARSVLQFAERAGDSSRYQLVPILKQPFAIQPGLAADLGDVLRTEESAPEVPLAIWASAFVQANPADAATYVVGLPRATQRDRQVLALLVELLPVREQNIAAALQSHQDALCQALLQDAPHAGVHFSVHWAAIRKLAESSPTAMCAVMDAANAGETPALIALANWLPGTTTPTLGATGVALTDIVDLLLRHSLTDEDLRRRAVDSSVAALIYNSDMRATVVSCVERLGTVDAPVARIFKETFEAIADQHAEFFRLLTAWLVGQGITFNALRSLLSMVSGRGVPPHLDAPTFMAAPMERKQVAARRLLALTMDGPALCRFIGELAESPALQPVGLDIARQMLQEAFVEYPGATEGFLRERTASLPQGVPFAPLYRAAQENALRWRNVLSELPQLKELQPSDTQLLALRALKQRISRDIHRAAERESIFGAFATKVHLAQGRRFTSHMQHGTPQVSSMSELSHTMELPSSEVSDPLGGMMRRARLLQGSR